MKRTLFLSTVIGILSLTFLFGPVWLAHQTVLSIYSVTNMDIAQSFNMFLGAVLMIGAIGVVTSVWLRFSSDKPMRLTGRQYLISTMILFTVGWLTSSALSWAYNKDVVQLEGLSLYNANMIWYGAPMLATLIAMVMLKRHLIQGESPLSGWCRRGNLGTPPTRAIRPIPETRYAGVASC